MTISKASELRKSRELHAHVRKAWFFYAAFIMISSTYCAVSCAQSGRTDAGAINVTEQKVVQLTSAMEKAQAQIEANQKLLLELQQELMVLKLQIAHDQIIAPMPQPPMHPKNADEMAKDSSDKPTDAQGKIASRLEELHERQAISESQIATHEMSKVETQSKYPLTLSGLVLFNTFVNTRQVDIPAAPAYVIPGSGSTGLSLKQTILGMDARGPHLFGAASYADIRVDFFSDSTQTGYTTGGGLRLRTAHAGLRWANTEAFFAFDRTLLEPSVPTSLLAVGQPELAWTGNLWAWNSQVGITQRLSVRNSFHVEAQAALIDPSDPHLPGVSGGSSASRSERSRWPGTEARVALQAGSQASGPEIGFGGYFSPHRTSGDAPFNAWAGTVDLRLPITHRFEITGNAYRGQALGGLGGSGYVDYVYRYVGDTEFARALDDVGGWAQLKATAGQRWELNTGYGIDNPFAKEVRASLERPFTSTYPGLIRNRSYFGNVIYSPSKYLLFSVEYRRLWSSYATGATVFGDVIGLGAGYKF